MNAENLRGHACGAEAMGWLDLAAYLREQADAMERGAVAWGMPDMDGAILDVIDPDEHARHEGGYTVPLFLHPAPQSVPADLLEAVDRVLEEAPCDCGDKRRYELGEHLCHCYLFDLNIARIAAASPATLAAPAPANVLDGISKLDPNEGDPGVLWAEIHRMAAALRGPDGFATWQDAATAERVRRVKAEGAASDVVVALRELVAVLSLKDSTVPGSFVAYTERLPNALSRARAALAAADQKEPKCES